MLTLQQRENEFNIQHLIFFFVRITFIELTIMFNSIADADMFHDFTLINYPGALHLCRGNSHMKIKKSFTNPVAV